MQPDENAARDTTAFAALANLLKESIPGAYEARRRMWAARDEVQRLEGLLASAKAVLAAAEREDQQTEKLAREIFDQLKVEHQALGATDE